MGKYLNHHIPPPSGGGIFSFFAAVSGRQQYKASSTIAYLTMIRDGNRGCGQFSPIFIETSAGSGTITPTSDFSTDRMLTRGWQKVGSSAENRTMDTASGTKKVMVTFGKDNGKPIKDDHPDCDFCMTYITSDGIENTEHHYIWEVAWTDMSGRYIWYPPVSKTISGSSTWTNI